MLTVQQWNTLRAGGYHLPQRSHVVVAPFRRWGDPCIAGHRLGTRMFAGMWWAGTWSVADFVHEYDVTRDDVLVACWFEAVYGTRATRKRWGGWAQKHFSALNEMRWDDVPMPPQKTAEAARA